MAINKRAPEFDPALFLSQTAMPRLRLTAARHAATDAKRAACCLRCRMDRSRIGCIGRRGKHGCHHGSDFYDDFHYLHSNFKLSKIVRQEERGAAAALPGRQSIPISSVHRKQEIPQRTKAHLIARRAGPANRPRHGSNPVSRHDCNGYRKSLGSRPYSATWHRPTDNRRSSWTPRHQPAQPTPAPAALLPNIPSNA